MSKTTSVISQKQQLLKHMQEHGGISTLEARQFYGIMGVAQRIKELREKGYPIKSPREKGIDHLGIGHNGIARYILVEASNDNRQ